ncbi:peptidyl-prolyl cis-trans isomerase, partial [Staphylococcus aureus]|nr:peptidyl-prolyl cis-trans isomerase [Staphylococcus aureus]
MSDIIMLTGKVNFTITLDPGVWIFDDRKVDLD